MNINGAQAIIEALLEEGVTTMFGYPGGGIMPFYDELYKNQDKIRHILVRHEQAAVHAAEGYARSSGKVGVCVATAGPGATNLVTGIADAMMDSTPIVCITAQVQKEGLGAASFQEADIISITMPITKWNYEITSADEIAPVLAKAFRIAQTGRPGPVVVSITKNAQTEMTEFEYKSEVSSYKAPMPAAESIERAVKWINVSRKPLVIAGHGVTLAGAEQALEDFVVKAGLPVATTMMGLSCLPSHHPNYMGCVGMHGSHAPNKMTQQADLIIAVGMRFSDRVTGNVATYAKQAKVIHIDIDHAEINKNVTVDVPIVGDSKEVLPMLTELVEQRDHSKWIESFAEYNAIEFEKVGKKALTPDGGPLLMGEVARKVSEATNNSAILVTDVGQNQMMSSRYFKYTLPRSILTSGGLGTMGYGLPAAIGAKMAMPERTVCLFTGDGGFQMNIQELGTIMEQGTAVKMVLLNNNYLGNVRQWQELFFDHRYSWTPMLNPEYSLIAKGYGIPSRLVIERAELDDAINEMLSFPGPFLLHVAVKEEDNVMPMTPPGATVSEMIFE